MNKIYSATYSNVPVYEYSVAGNHVMRRRSDDWINATHILKVADFDKPARTRILEREVQRGTHEKVQGGYGKYQGTWIPLEDGKLLAERNGVLEKLRPIFEFVPGDRSPPPAPKHATAASAKPKAPKTTAASRNRVPVPQPSRMSEMSFDTYSQQMNDDDIGTPDNRSVRTESDEDMLRNSQYSNHSRKRKRGVDQPQQMSYEDQQHLLWTDELLDYFMLQNSNDPLPAPPEPPATIDLNRPVDDKGHTPMHWAAAMGDLNVVHELIRRGARIDTLAYNGESPLMRAVIFTNNWDKQTMGRLIQVLQPTVEIKDWFGSTVFHHIAVTTCSKSKYPCARYYMDTILNKLTESYSSQYITSLLDQQDNNGDTPILLAARYGARKCVRSLLGRNASVDIPNHRGETADQLIKELNARRRDRYRQGSSSPFQQQPSNGASRTHQRSSSDANQNSFLLHAATGPSGATPTTAAPSHFRSEAAALLTSQLPNLVTARAESLALALDTELAEREAEAAEGERLLAQRRRELELLQKQAAAFASSHDAAPLDDAAADPADAPQASELAALTAEVEALVEAQQAGELARLLHEHESRIPASPRDAPDLAEKATLARALAAQQAARKALVRDLVAAQSFADGESDAAARPGSRQDMYKRLIRSALGVDGEDVEALLPEVLAELEDAAAQQAERGGRVDADGDVGMFDAGKGGAVAAVGVAG